jgi:hypothetical protein
MSRRTSSIPQESIIVSRLLYKNLRCSQASGLKLQVIHNLSPVLPAAPLVFTSPLCSSQICCERFLVFLRATAFVQLAVRFNHHWILLQQLPHSLGNPSDNNHFSPVMKDRATLESIQGMQSPYGFTIL